MIVSCNDNTPHHHHGTGCEKVWWQGRDSNPRPSGYEPDEIPNFSTLRNPMITQGEKVVNTTTHPEDLTVRERNPCPIRMM